MSPVGTESARGIQACNCQHQRQSRWLPAMSIRCYVGTQVDKGRKLTFDREATVRALRRPRPYYRPACTALSTEMGTRDARWRSV